MSTSNIGAEGFKWFIGIVEDTADPLMLGRVRVRVFQEHSEDISTDQLHWAIMIMPVTSASLNSVGQSPTGIAVNSYVFGFFIDGKEKQFPAILGTWHKIPGMDVNRHDVSALARGTQTLTKEQIGPEPASAYATEYPNNKVIQTLSGHAIEIDDTPNAERLHVYHKSGSYIEINQDGRTVTKIVDDDINVVIKNKTIYVNSGDITITAAGGKITMTSAKDVTIKSNSKISLTAPNIKSSANWSHDGDINMSGTLTATNDVVGGGKSLKSHVHGGVQTGGGTTSSPL